MAEQNDFVHAEFLSKVCPMRREGWKQVFLAQVHGATKAHEATSQRTGQALLYSVFASLRLGAKVGNFSDHPPKKTGAADHDQRPRV